MRTPVIDGRSIEQFIPANLRGMFYANPIPQYKYAVHDGYDPYGFSTEGLVLYLPLWALKDSGFKSIDAYQHSCVVAGPLWLPDGRNYDGNDDLITANSVTDDAFFDGAHTIVTWAKLSDWGSDHNFFSAGRAENNYRDGFYFAGGSSRIISEVAVSGLGTNTIASLETYNSDSDWHMFAMTVNASGHITDFLIDDISQGSNSDAVLAIETFDKVYVGQLTHGGSNISPYQGTIGEVWVYSGELATVEMEHTRQTTMWRYQ